MHSIAPITKPYRSADFWGVVAVIVALYPGASKVMNSPRGPAPASEATESEIHTALGVVLLWYAAHCARKLNRLRAMLLSSYSGRRGGDGLVG